MSVGRHDSDLAQTDLVPTMIPELRDLSYEECIRECGLTTLETRRLRGDHIEVFSFLSAYPLALSFEETMP